jgi:hypothetical protein
MSDAVGFVNKGNDEVAVGAALKLITDRISEAKTTYRAARDAALDTVGHIVLIWKDVLSDVADKGNADWYNAEIIKRNKVITDHNDNVAALYTRAKNFMEGKLKAEDPINAKAENEEHRSLLEEEKAKLRELFGHSREERYAKKMVKYFPDDENKRVIDLVKYVLMLENPADSDIASRYAAVTQWVVGQILEEKFNTVQDVTDFLKENGGFEIVLAKQRALRGDDDSNNNNDIINADVQSQAKILLRGMNPKGTVELHSTQAKDNYVLLLGRSNGGQTDILGEIKATDNEINNAVMYVSDQLKDPATPHCEFLANAVRLGKIVGEGDSDGVTRDGTQGGEVLKSERTMVLRPEADGRAKFVISARNIDASPVIYGWPSDWPELDEIKKDVMLPDRHRKQMERDLENRLRRRRIEFEAKFSPKRADGTPALSPLAFDVFYAALEEKKPKSARQQFFWNFIGNADRRPVDQEHFDHQFEDVLDQEDIAILLTGPFNQWSKEKGSNKNKAPVLFAYDGKKLSVKVNGNDPIDFIRKVDLGAKYKMSFRAREFHRLLQALAAEDCQSFRMRGDEGGLLEISWTNSTGQWAVYMPTVNAKGDLETRRVSPMRVKNLQQAAE